ncbi:MAG: VCBS repeat-containing protein, partial [Candidatus Margulisiibacteriota bacterium]
MKKWLVGLSVIVCLIAMGGIITGCSELLRLPTTTTTSTTTSTTTTVIATILGDVNGDGYSDVIVGAMGADGGGENRGQAYVYFGGTSMDNTADVTFSGGADYDNFAVSVSSAGDVNGDGYVDVIVGAYYADGGGTNSGQAYIYFGGTSMDNTADVTITGGAEWDGLGYSVSSAGDVNGDGYVDVIVGA